MSDTQPRDTQNDRIDLCVVHGHLAFARFPVLVGHYIGDTFAGAEARLDRALGYRLTERRKLGLYPGRIGTCAILVDPTCQPSGAVVVGLGQPAGLSIGALRETFRRGIVAFVVELLDRANVCASSADQTAQMGLSTLLVGAGAGGVDRNSCVQALLQATSQANALLAGLQKPGARLTVVEIIELYEDRAYETWRAVKKAIENDPILKGVFRFPPSSARVRRPPPCADRAGPKLVGADPDHHAPRRGAEDRSLSFTVGGGGFARTERERLPPTSTIVAPLCTGGPECRPRRSADLAWADPVRIAVAGFAEAPQRPGAEQAKAILDEQSRGVFRGNCSMTGGLG